MRHRLRHRIQWRLQNSHAAGTNCPGHGNLGELWAPGCCRCFPIFTWWAWTHAHPDSSALARFEQADLGREPSCWQLIELLRATGAQSVIHLAFVLDPQRSGVLDPERMWQINVAGTARVMEAVSVVNRTGGQVRQFIFPSSVAVYGPETAGPVNEDAPLRAHTLPYAIHKRECDEVVRYRAESLGDCHTYMLRPHIFAGASVQNYMIGALRGTPLGNSKRAARMRACRQALALVASSRQQVSGEALPVCTRGRHGTVAGASVEPHQTAIRHSPF